MMNDQLTVGSLFSGVGCFDLGLERAGMRCIWQCEADKTARSVLKRHWPDVPIYEDIRKIDTEQLVRDGLRPDVIVGGWPCQDLSVAGRRAGLAGERSGLFFEMLRVIEGLRPQWFIAENVPGLLSSNGGEDFAAVLRGLVQCGYGVSWRILDAQFFGVPQRRRRVFLVGHFGSGCSAQVLFEPKGLRGDFEARGAPREDIAGTLGGGSGQPRWPDDTDRMTFVASTVSASMGGGHRGDGRDNLSLARCLTTREGQRQNHTLETIVYDPTQITSAENRSNPQVGDPSHTLAAKGHAPMIVFQERGRAGGRNLDSQEDVAYALTAPRGGGRRHEMNILPVAFSCKDAEVGHWEDVAPTLRGPCHAASHQNGGGQVAVFEPRVARNGRGAPEDIVPPLKAQSGQTGKGDSAPCVTGRSVGPRRLTPRECERLQGLPDDHTRYDADGKEIADGPRYRMIGNGGAVPVMEWIGKRIVEMSK